MQAVSATKGKGKKVASRENMSKFSFSGVRVKKKDYISNCCNPFLLPLDAGWSFLLTGRTLVIWGITLEGHGPTPRFPEDSRLSHLRGKLKESFYT